MQKGKFGFSLWLYPFIALWTMLVGPAIGPLLILGFVVFAERDEWVIKQCAYAVMFSIYWSVYSYIMDTLIGSLSSIPLIGGAAALPLNIIDTIVWIVLVVMVMVQGLGKLKKGQDIALPGKKIVNMAYGFVQTYVQNYPGQQQQYAPPAGQQYAPQQWSQGPAVQQTPTAPPQANYAAPVTAPPPPQNFTQTQPGSAPNGLQPPPPPPGF